MSAVCPRYGLLSWATLYMLPIWVVPREDIHNPLVPILGRGVFLCFLIGRKEEDEF